MALVVKDRVQVTSTTTGTGTFTLGSITMNPTISWIRLLVAQPLLIIWAWQISKD